MASTGGSTMASSPDMEVPSHRACAHCRAQKVRCLPDDSNADVCQRCARSGRPCVFAPLQKRKQRKRTDTRVAELEREMRAMRSIMKNKQDAGKPGPSQVHSGRPTGPSSSDNATPTSHTRRPPVSKSMLGDALGSLPPSQSAPTQQTRFPDGPTQSTHTPQPRPSDRPTMCNNDVVDRGMLSMATARQLFDTYREDLFPHYPMVAIPDSISAEEMRRTEPTLFLAVIAAAATKDHSELSAALDKEVLQAYATRSLMQSEKSLELVQALLISAVWYNPPSKFGQLKYYEYINMAATMAMDIGIGTRPVLRRGRFGSNTLTSSNHSGMPPENLIHPAEDAANPDLSMTPRLRGSSADTGSVESRRTFLACYIVCAGLSLSLRRPNLLRASSYIRECVDYLERSPSVLTTDRTLVAWVKLAMIAEEISISFSYDDAGSIASITELRTQLMLTDFEKRLAAWYADVPQDNGSLNIMYYTVRLYLHEIALHIDHSPEDFQAPYQMGTIHPSHCEDIPTRVLASSIAECVTCSHSLLDTFLDMEVDSLRALPVFSYVRVSFAAFVLAKLCLSASHPDSRIGKVMDRSNLKVERYMDRAIFHVREVVGPKGCRVPAIFLALLFKLRQWCMNPEMIGRSLGPTGETSERIPQTATRPREVMAIEGPRFTEHSSSSDSSPQTLAGGQQAAFESVTGVMATDAAYQAMLSSGAPSFSGAYNYTYTTNARDTGPVTGTSAAGNNELQGDEYDQMQLDPEFLASLGDLADGFPEGGLTGLDDWIPGNDFMMGMGQAGSMLDWETHSGAGSGTSMP